MHEANASPSLIEPGMDRRRAIRTRGVTTAGLAGAPAVLRARFRLFWRAGACRQRQARPQPRRRYFESQTTS